MTPSPTHPAPGLPERLGLIVSGLRRNLAFQAGRDRLLAPLVLLLWGRLSRLLVRVGAACAHAGRGAARAATSHPPRRSASPPPPPRDPLPRQFGWLLRRVPGCIVYGGHLAQLLDDPEIQQLLATSPRLRRLLRPLWRMLRYAPAPDSLRTAPATPAASPPRRRRRTPSVQPPDMRPPDMRPPDMRPPDMQPPDMQPPDMRSPDMRAATPAATPPDRPLIRRPPPSLSRRLV